MLLKCSVSPPSSSELANLLLRLLKGSLNLFWPTTSERCSLLIGYLKKYVSNDLKGSEPQILQMLMVQLSKPAVITDLLKQASSKNNSEPPTQLIDSLVDITVKEWKVRRNVHGTLAFGRLYIRTYGALLTLKAFLAPRFAHRCRFACRSFRCRSRLPQHLRMASEPPL